MQSSAEQNPAFGKWSVEETNWSPKDTAFIKAVKENSKGTVKTSLKQLKELHKSLPY